MKLIVAIIQPYKLDEVHEALAAIGLKGMTVTEVKGFGRQQGHTEIYRGAEYPVHFVPKLKIEIGIEDSSVGAVVSTIRGAANTDRVGLSVEYLIDTLMENVEICMGRKSIRIQKPSNEHDGIIEIDVTKHDAAGVVASCTLLGKHLGMFTERAEVKIEAKVDVTDPQEKLQLAREILFMIAKAEHGVKQRQAKIVDGTVSSGTSTRDL